MRSRLPLLLACLLLTGCGSRWRVNSRPWTPPPGVMPGVQLVGLQRWGGYFSNAGVEAEGLELRCVRLPLLRTRREYWPGATWNGVVTWTREGVTDTPPSGNRPRVQPFTLRRPWWVRLCPH